MGGYGRDATRIPSVVSMNFVSGVFASKSLGSLYVLICEIGVKEIELCFTYFLLIIVIYLVLFAFHVAAACCKSYIARNVENLLLHVPFIYLSFLQ